MCMYIYGYVHIWQANSACVCTQQANNIQRDVMKRQLRASHMYSPHIEIYTHCMCRQVKVDARGRQEGVGSSSLPEL